MLREGSILPWQGVGYLLIRNNTTPLLLKQNSKYFISEIFGRSPFLLEKTNTFSPQGINSLERCLDQIATDHYWELEACITVKTSVQMSIF